MVKRIFSLLIIFSLSSCVTEKELLSKTTNSAMFLDGNLNGIYSNVNVGLQETANLSDLFLKYERIRFDEKRNNSLDSLETKIEYDGDNKLTITFLDSNSVVHRFDLKVKNKGNYLSLRRKLFVIPIPFLFYVHRERKGILFNDNNGDLHIISGEENSIWIFMAASVESTDHHKFEKKK